MKTKPFLYSLCASLILCAAAPLLPAAVPATTSYQGRVAVSGAPFTGSGLFRFALINKADGSSLWSNDATSAAGSEPTDAVTLVVTDGLFTVLIGDTTLVNMGALPADLFALNSDVCLRVWFDDGVNGSFQLTPDTRLASVPYALAADIRPGSVTADQLNSGGIPPAPGQFLSYDGGNFVWTDPGVSVGDVWSKDGANAYYNSGYVGIGTVSPVSKFHVVSGASDLPARLQSSGTTGFGAGWDFYHGTVGKAFVGVPDAAAGLGAGELLMYGGPATKVSLWSAGNRRLTVDTAGRVGIGTDTPATKLTVRTSGLLSLFGGYGIEHTDGTVRLSTYIDGSAGWLGTVSNHPLNFFVNDGLPSMTIDGNGTSMVSGPGFVTVGTPNGESGLTITRGGNRADVRFEGSTLKLVAGPVGGPPGSTRGLAVTTDGNVGIGTLNPSRTLEVNGDFYARDASVRVLTIRGGADLAEPFAMSHSGVEPGSVVVIDEDHPGKLRRSTRAYDKKAAGIVSGANGIRPGISMVQEDKLEAGENVALSGRVYVHADAAYGEIKPGDLLTTSDTPGHAMKVTAHEQAQGAILGKAMGGLKDGKGMVLVLVTLQ